MRIPTVFLDGDPNNRLDGELNSLCGDSSSATIYRKTTSKGDKTGWEVFGSGSDGGSSAFNPSNPGPIGDEEPNEATFTTLHVLRYGFIVAFEVSDGAPGNPSFPGVVIDPSSGMFYTAGLYDVAYRPLVVLVDVPPTTDTAGYVGQFAIDRSRGLLIFYTGNGNFHDWGQINYTQFTP